ncbi:hypothetical protein BMT49_04475 [Escherichia coli]|nr:hypothetical protein BMT49_04475 [Escherichia coli]
MKPQEIFLSILGLPLQTQTIWMVVPSLHGGNINMLTKYALVAVMVLCLKVIFIRFIRSNSDCKRIKKILIELSNLLPE